MIENIDELQNEVDRLNEIIKELNTEINDKNAEIAELEEKIEIFKGLANDAIYYLRDIE